MQTNFALSAYGSVQSEVMRQADPTNFWVNVEFEIRFSFVVMVHVYNDKTATTIKPKAVGPQTLLAVLLNVTDDLNMF